MSWYGGSRLDNPRRKRQALVEQCRKLDIKATMGGDGKRCSTLAYMRRQIRSKGKTPICDDDAWLRKNNMGQSV